MKYILFGTGDYYNRFSHWFVDREVVAVLDNDKNKQGKDIDGYPIIAPSDVTKYEYDAIIILSFYISDMKKQLVEWGVSEDKIYHFYDLHDVFSKENNCESYICKNRKSVLLLSHDLSLGGPALALYHAAKTLVRNGYDVMYASMMDGELRIKLEESYIPVIVDKRLQVNTMLELSWTKKFDLILCNTISYHVFLAERDTTIPVIWWLHDSSFFYEGIRDGKIESINMDNMKVLSVGPVPKEALNKKKPDVEISDLIYGVSNVV